MLIVLEQDTHFDNLQRHVIDFLVEIFAAAFSFEAFHHEEEYFEQVVDHMQSPKIVSINASGVVEVFLILQNFLPNSRREDHLEVAESQIFIIPNAILVNNLLLKINDIFERALIPMPAKIDHSCLSFL